MDANFLRAIGLDECRRYIDEVGDVLKLMTLSPELDGGAALIHFAPPARNHRLAGP